jgi:hypothetical protein
MGFKCWRGDAFGGTSRIWELVAALSLSVLIGARISRAGDTVSQPADNLTITNSVTNLLPQTAAAAASGPAVAPPAPGGEESWLSGLHISGYGSQTFGMWQNPTTLRQYTRSRNNLAVARSLLQIDENYRLNENNSFFMREWFVYEPPYSFNSANNPFWAAATRSAGPTAATSANPFCFANTFCRDTAPNGSSFGDHINGVYNTYDVRDAWWENKTGPLDIYIGNQIVVWGQSLAFRVGDVVNPQDTCWAFGFANLEQSRIPQWMIHPILNLPVWGPFTSNFLELVVQPGFQPTWGGEQQNGGFYSIFKDQGIKAGRVAPCLPGASRGPAARFDVGYSTQPVFGADWITSPIGPYSNSGAQLAGPCDTNGPCVATNLVAPYGSREFFLCAPFSGMTQRGWNPYAVYLRRFPGGMNCDLGLTKNQGVTSPAGDGALVDFGLWHVPGMQPENWNEGVRFHTLYGLTEWTALYYNDNTSQGYSNARSWTFGTNLWTHEYHPLEEAGVTVDRPVPVPATMAEYFPAVFRGEFLYQNHNLFESMKFTDMNDLRYSDVVKYMLAVDLDQAYAPWLTSTGNLTANVEVYDSIVMDNSKLSFEGTGDENQIKNDVSMLFNLGTSWWWGDFSPTFTGIYQPKGTTFALFPTIVLNPPWTKKYFMSLEAIEVLGGDKRWGLGAFKGQSYLIAQFQYNFDLM